MTILRMTQTAENCEFMMVQVIQKVNSRERERWLKTCFREFCVAAFQQKLLELAFSPGTTFRRKVKLCVGQPPIARDF